MANGVRGNQPKTSVLSQQIKRPPIEVRDQIGVAMRFLVDSFEPVKIPLTVAVDQRVFPSERRIAHHRIKPTILASEHFRKLDLPVERLDGLRAAAQCVRGFRQWQAVFNPPLLAHIVDQLPGQGIEPLDALTVLIRRKERRNHQVARQLDQ